MKSGLIVILLSVLFLNCSKNSTIAKDTELPVITLDYPHESQVFDDGDTVTISGSITDDKYIAEVHILVTDLNSGATYVHAHLYPATTFANFNQDFVAASGIDYKVELIVLDRSMNQAVASVEIFCN